MKCNDCGKVQEKMSLRLDLCQDCWDLRAKLIESVKAGKVSMDEFKELQRLMANRSGQAAAAVRRVLGLTAPEI